MSESEEKKYKFDCFKFISNRKMGIPPSDDELNNFGNFMACAALSMYREYAEDATRFNTIQFSKLTKFQQCMAYTSLDGFNKLDPRRPDFRPWLKKGSKTEVKITKELLSKICKVLKCSAKDAKDIIRNKFINLDELLYLYAEMYDPASLVSLKSGKVKDSL